MERDATPSDFEGYFSERDTPGEPVELSRRQLEVLRAAAAGLGIHATADVMGVSANTVVTHLRLARAKMHARTTTHAVANAIRRGLL